MPSTLSIDTKLLERTFVALCLSAGATVLKIRNSGFETVHKADNSPVTEADRQAEAIILSGLRSVFPEIPIIAEEEAASGTFEQHGDVFFLVDPLDGTKEFAAGSDEFTVNIALIDKGVPVAGCIYAPAMGLLYFGAGSAGYKMSVENDKVIGSKETLRTQSNSPSRILASKSHLSDATRSFLNDHPNASISNIGSSLKFCMIAQGDADIYPRHSPTMEWDTAAGDAILRSAGGMIRAEDGQPLQYGDKNRETPRRYENGNFIASAK